MDPLFSNPEGPARTSGRVIEAVPEDDPVAALRAREELKRQAREQADELGEEQADAMLKEAYGKSAEELADEAEKGYDVSKMKPMDDEAKARADARRVRKAVKDVSKISAEELMAEVGVEPIYSTTEAAEFFDRSNQWLYWGLREGVFVDDEGVVIDPDRVGDPKTGRRRFTLTIVKQILLSSYRRGNIEPDEMTKILLRIKIAKVGGEWREAEGWHKVQVSKNKQRWVHPDKCEKVDGKWQLRQDAELEGD